MKASPMPRVYYTAIKRPKASWSRPWIVMEFIDGHHSATWQFSTGAQAHHWVDSCLVEGSTGVRRAMARWVSLNLDWTPVLGIAPRMDGSIEINFADTPEGRRMAALAHAGIIDLGAIRPRPGASYGPTLARQQAH